MTIYGNGSLDPDEREKARRLMDAYQRACDEMQELRDKIAKLEVYERAELDRTANARRLEAALADAEGVELHRQSAWIESGKARWDSERAEYVFPPERWPSGWTAEETVARFLGLVVRERVVLPKITPAEIPTIPDNPFRRRK